MSREQVAVAKAGLKAAKALEKACTAMNVYLRACSDADIPLKGADDGRLLLIGSMSEFSSYLFGQSETGGGA